MINTKRYEKGIALIKQYEGCVLKVYLDAIGIPTCGYGHTKGLSKADVGKTITQKEADDFLLSDLETSVSRVEKYNDIYNFTDNEASAMLSFAFNIGSIDQLTANGTRTMQQIADKIVEYNKAGGKVLQGLVKRRKAEQELFTRGWKNNMTIQTFSLKHDGNKQLSENFKVKEFKCNDGSDTILIDVDFVRTKLQDIRSHFGAPVTINSAYRTPTYNAKVGGAKSSYHLKGQAFDIVVKGHTPQEVARYCKLIGIKGVIQYNTFVHVDSRGIPYFARNNNGKVSVVTNF